MKKLIAIAVVFVLVAGAAFADISVSGSANGKATLGGGSSGVTSGTAWTGQNTVDGGVGDISIAAEAQNEDGTFGGKVSFQDASFAKVGGGGGGEIVIRGMAWWKPIPQVKVQIGSDGSFGFDNVLGWGLYQGDNDYLDLEGWSHPSIYGGSGDGVGLFLTVSPVANLEVNLFIPFGRYGNDPWETYAKTHLQIKYGIDNIGTFALSYKGDTYGYKNGADIYAGFELTALEGLNVFLGVGFDFPTKLETLTVVSAGVTEYKTTKTYNDPLWIGLGASYSAGAFGIKARFELGFGYSEKTEYAAVTGTLPASLENSEDKGSTAFTFDLFPYYNVNDNLKIGLGGGLDISAPVKDPSADNTTVDYRIQPFLSFSSGGGTFWAGFLLKGSSTGPNNSSSSWAIPIGLKFGL
jgi:hypothetical protein